MAEEIQFEEHLKALCKAIKQGTYHNEAEVRSEFMRNLRNFLDQPDFKGVSIREEETIVESRPDARIGGISIEFETPFDERNRIRGKVTESKIRKIIQKYVKEFKKVGRPSRVIVTNGLEIVFIDENGNVVDRGTVC